MAGLSAAVYPIVTLERSGFTVKIVPGCFVWGDLRCVNWLDVISGGELTGC